MLIGQKYKHHLSIFVCGFIVNLAKNVANDMTPYPNKS